MLNDTLLENLFIKIAFNDDQEAFEELFFNFYPSLCVFAGRYIASATECEDVVQETFYKLWKNRKNIEITSSFRNFLITSVKNNCTDYIRKQSVRKNHLESKIILDTIDTPEEIYTINELEEILHSALNNLPPNVCRAFKLNRFENLTYTKIAEEMEVSQKTVESYISKALRMLRIELKDYLPLLL